MDSIEAKLTDELAKRTIPLTAQEFVDAVLTALNRTPEERNDATGEAAASVGDH